MEASTSDMSSPSGDTRMVMDALSEMQFLASRVADQRRAVVALDERRQKLREAERALRKTNEKKTFVCVGSTAFLKCPSSLAVDILKADMKTVDQTIKDVNGDIKQTVDSLMKIEGAKDLATRGFDLTAVTETITEEDVDD